jgi:alpha-1,6-mannosyltransferase
MVNYPGGVSLVRFNEHYKGVSDGIPSLSHRNYSLSLTPVHVHVSNLAAQTGASLFLQTYSAPFHPSLPNPPLDLNWTYNKTENLTTYSPSRFTHLIAEASEPVPRGWRKVECVEGLGRWSLFDAFSNFDNLDTAGWGTLLTVSRQTLTMEMNDELCILEKS